MITTQVTPNATAAGRSAHPDVWASVAPLPGGEWTIWRTGALRGAGFAASLVLTLVGPRASAAVDECVRAESDVLQRRKAALAGLSTYTEDPATRRANRRRRRTIRNGAVQAGGGAAERMLAEALDARIAAHARLLEAYEADMAAIQERIRAIARAPRFQEAVLWQNHSALSVTIRRLLECGGAPSELRRAAALIASYLQRYAVKNDTIGFFGPVGWASLVDRTGPPEVEPGPELVAGRAVRFEGWCIDALASALDLTPGMRLWTAPRRKAGVWIGPGVVCAPMNGEVAVTRAERLVLVACDGTRTAAEIARGLLADPASGFRSEADVVAVLERLVARHLVSWRLEVAPQVYPERELARHIEKIGSPAARAACQDALGALVAARDAVAGAAGRPAELEPRLQDLDRTFTRLTGHAPTRRPGETYAARGLVYEDCRRACRVTFGREFLDRLGPPLTIMLEGARWVAVELAAAVNAHLRRCHAELRARARREAIDGHLFFSYVRATMTDAAPLSREVVRRLQARWQGVLETRDDRWSIHTVEEIAPKAAAAFSTSGAWWSRAGYFSPDILVAARGPDALRRGEFHFVLGELHGTNTLGSAVFVMQHPDPDEMIGALTEQTRHETVVMTQIPKQHWAARTHAIAIPPTAWRYEWGDDPPVSVECRSMPAAMLLAVDDGRAVRMRARDGSLEFDAIELFGEPLCVELHDVIAQWLPNAPHTPRITIGDLTVSRERWYVPSAELPDVDHPTDAAQFAAVRAWAHARGMPRHVFYKSPDERKPCFLDFDSPILVKLFAKIVRRLAPGASLRITEMLPRLDETWLVDAEGARYTSELRFVMRPPRPGAGAAGGAP